MQGEMHRIRSLTPLQAPGNALAMHVQNELAPPQFGTFLNLKIRICFEFRYSDFGFKPRHSATGTLEGGLFQNAKVIRNLGLRA